MEVSGFLHTLDEDQKSALEQLKEEIAETEYADRALKHRHGDRWLLRILRATMKDKNKRRIFVVKAAKERLISILDWKEKYSVSPDNVPEKLDLYKKVYPSYQVVDDKAGTLLWIQRQGEFVTSVKRDVLTEDEWNTCCGHSLEHVENILHNLIVERGKELEGYISVADMKSLGFGMLSRFGALQNLSKIAAENYPEMVGRIIIIRTPWVFPKLFAFAKPFLDATTLAKFEIHSKLPKKLLREIFDPANLPVEYGGENEATVPHPLHAIR